MQVEMPESERLERHHYLVEGRQFMRLAEAVEFAVVVALEQNTMVWLYRWSDQQPSWMPYRSFAADVLRGLVREAGEFDAVRPAV